ncbi:YadA-like family protein [uncultured Veillonella sp.]|jgi:autotransporter adhesin|uniref:YadA-like family protein n=1 Tax=uncultured Veillonella sp. TaxID=159268 RepID=UPI00288A3B04|nr:YadA-like family protein [uncultured Veillonella sp.]
MSKTVTAVLAISALAVNVAGATSNNTVGGTNNTISTNSTSSAVWGFQNNIDANNALAFGTNNTVSGENGFAGGNDAKAAGRNSFAFGSHAESLVEYTVAIGNQARTASYDSVAIGNGAFVSGESSVAFGRSNNVTGENSVAVGANNGTVSGGQSAVIGYNNTIGADKEQLVFGSNSESNGQGALVFGTHAKSLATDAVAFGNNTIADRANSVAIGTNAVTDDAVGVDGVDLNGTRHIFAGEQPGAVVSFGSKARTGAGGVAQYNRQLQNVSAGRVEADSLDAVNGSQLFAAYDEINTLGAKVRTNTSDISTLQGTSANHEGRITALELRTYNMAGEINNRINATEQRINKLGASSAALAGLHPLEFNRNDKVSYSISYGYYRNSNAVALGVFARPNERIMLGFGATLGAENQYNVSVSFKTGRGADYVAEARDAQSRISKLEALVAKLMAEVEK